MSSVALKLVLAFWKPLAIVAVVAAVYGAGYLKGYSRADAKCEREALKAQLVETERQRRASESALGSAERRLNQSSDEIAKLNVDLDAFEAKLAHRDACLLDDDDARRLRNIR